jgi:hypothetical protein
VGPERSSEKPSEAARVHHTAWSRGSGVAARGAARTLQSWTAVGPRNDFATYFAGSLST